MVLNGFLLGDSQVSKAQGSLYVMTLHPSGIKATGVLSGLGEPFLDLLIFVFETLYLLALT